MGDYDYDVTQHAECDEARFAIVEPIILDRIGDAVNTSVASARSRPCLRRFVRRLTGSQTILTAEDYAYIHTYMQRLERENQERLGAQTTKDLVHIPGLWDSPGARCRAWLSVPKRK